MRGGSLGSAIVGAGLAALVGFGPGLVPATAHAADTVRVGGTGFAIALMRTLGERVHESRPDIETVILPSLGSGGGLAALADGAIEFAVSARPLTSAEQGKGLREAACATTPLTFATSRPNGGSLALRDLAALYAEPSPRWPDGMRLKVILRDRNGAEVPYLSAHVPGMRDAFAAAFARPGIAVGATDQENAELAQRIEGSLAIITLLQIRTERLALRPMSLDGLTPSTDAIAAGAWPLPIRFCLVLPATPAPAARHMVAFFGSADGQAMLVRSGARLTD
jgi:phosphate transport system substrate-binding protein